jgi:hypothetical protein
MATQSSAKLKTARASNGNRSAELQPQHDIVQYLREYARERPDVAALWCFGIGFVLGWKLKPW